MGQCVGVGGLVGRHAARSIQLLKKLFLFLLLFTTHPFVFVLIFFYSLFILGLQSTVVKRFVSVMQWLEVVGCRTLFQYV